MGAQDNLSPEEQLPILEQKVRELEGQVNSQAVEIEELQNKVKTLEAEEATEGEGGTEESAELKELKQKLTDAKAKFQADEQVVTNDEAEITQIESEIKAAGG